VRPIVTWAGLQIPGTAAHLVDWVSERGTNMPRYFINFQNVHALDKDEQASICRAWKLAREAALISAREILADNIRAGAKDSALAWCGPFGSLTKLN
jgi:hypothetical protein